MHQKIAVNQKVLWGNEKSNKACEPVNKSTSNYAID